MRYKVFASGEGGHYTFCEESEEKAKVLFNMARYCGMFEYARLDKTFDEDIFMTDWAEES